MTEPDLPNESAALAPAGDDLRTRILEHAASGNLLSLIEDRFGAETPEDVDRAATLCAELHNLDEINLVAVAFREPDANATAHDFFTLQQLFVAAIPGLEISVAEMLALVEGLVKRGGDDYMASEPNTALLAWLKKDLGRAEELVTLAADGDVLAVQHLTFALQALGDVERTQQLASEVEGLRRLSALTALARLPHTAAQALATRTLIDELLGSEPDDGLRNHAIVALFESAASAADGETIDVWETLAVATAGAGAETQYQCARQLHFHGHQISGATLDRLLQALAVIPAEHQGTVRAFDQGLWRMFERDSQAAIDAGTAFLSNPENSHTLTDLPSFSTTLLNAPEFGATVLAWLRTGEHVLCEGLHDLLQKRDRAGAPLHLPADPAFSDDDAVFIAHKAIGYFFTQPVIAASVLLCFLRQRDRSCAPDLEDLLGDPLLVNYGGELRDYLLTIDGNDPAYESVQRALAGAETYLEALKAVGPIPELRPSESHRRIDRIRQADQMREIMKDARKESVFFNLVSHSTVLHGGRTRSYRSRDDGEPLQKFDMDLSSHGVSFELPRTEAVDPLGLDNMLLTCRSLTRPGE